MVAQARTHAALTPKQEFFARLVAQGKGSSEAYRIAYAAGQMAATAIKSNAYKLATTPHIAAKIRELQEQADSNAVLTRTRKRHLLWEIAEAKRNKPMERIAAMSEDSKMVGDYQAVKIEGDITLISALGQLKHAEPVIELDETPAKPALPAIVEIEPEQLHEPEAVQTGLQDQPLEAAPFDSGPFGAMGEVSVAPSVPDAVKLTRSRSYDE